MRRRRCSKMEVSKMLKDPRVETERIWAFTIEDGPVVRELMGGQIRLTRVTAKLIESPSDPEDEPFFEVSYRGRPLKKDGSPDKRGTETSGWGDSWDPTVREITAYLRDLYGPKEEG
jgi:hypothetical protein